MTRRRSGIPRPSVHPVHPRSAAPLRPSCLRRVAAELGRRDGRVTVEVGSQLVARVAVTVARRGPQRARVDARAYPLAVEHVSACVPLGGQELVLQVGAVLVCLACPVVAPLLGCFLGALAALQLAENLLDGLSALADAG